MQVRVITPGELGPSEIAAWRACQAAQPELSSPFLSPEFAQAVGRARPDARVAVVEDDLGLAGFFAFEVAADDVGRPIGSGICDAQAFVCRAELEWDAQWLVGASGLAAWRFDHLGVEQPAFRPFYEALHRSPVIDLERGHDAFLADVRLASKDVLAQVGRRRRKLEREVGLVTTEWTDASTASFEALTTWKSAQYAATGVWDRFAQPWIRGVIDDLRQQATPGCTGVLATTRAGGRLAAVHFGLVGPRSLCWWFPAYETELSAYSPGLILLLDLAQHAAARSLTTIDLGRGEHDYKMRVATGSHDVAEGVVPAG